MAQICTRLLKSKLSSTNRIVPKACSKRYESPSPPKPYEAPKPRWPSPMAFRSFFPIIRERLPVADLALRAENPSHAR